MIFIIIGALAAGLILLIGVVLVSLRRQVPHNRHGVYDDSGTSTGASSDCGDGDGD